MPKKTSILIITLAIITVILIFLAVRNEKSANVEEKRLVIIPTVVPTLAPFASLSFATKVLDLSDSKKTQETVDVIIDTKGRPVSEAQLELLYDPEIIFDVVISNPEGSFFGSNAIISIKNVDEKQGRVSYVVSLPSKTDEKSGLGVVMRMNFKVNKKLAKNTSVTFLPKSMVQSLKSPSTVLEQTVPLLIILSK